MLEVKHWGDHRLGIIWLIIGNDPSIMAARISPDSLQAEPVARINNGRSKLEMTAIFTRIFFPTLSAVAT